MGLSYTEWFLYLQWSQPWALRWIRSGSCCYEVRQERELQDRGWMHLASWEAAASWSPKVICQHVGRGRFHLAGWLKAARSGCEAYVQTELVVALTEGRPVPLVSNILTMGPEADGSLWNTFLVKLSPTLMSFPLHVWVLTWCFVEKFLSNSTQYPFLHWAVSTLWFARLMAVTSQGSLWSESVMYKCFPEDAHDGNPSYWLLLDRWELRTGKEIILRVSL